MNDRDLNILHPAAVRCDMVLHQACHARRERKHTIGGEVRHGATSGVSCETALNKHVTPHLYRDERPRDAPRTAQRLVDTR